MSSYTITCMFYRFVFILAPLLLVASPAWADDVPWSSASFGVEPRLGTYRQGDERLVEYGFAPIASPLMVTWGLRARFSFGGDVYLPLIMTYAFSSTSADENPVPTTSTLIESGAGVGYKTSRGMFVEGVAGFGVLSHTVGSPIEGGALVYMGPTIHPRVGYMWSLDRQTSPMFAVSVGYALHLAPGSAHQNPLWEEPFDRVATHALTLGFESGLQLRGSR